MLWSTLCTFVMLICEELARNCADGQSPVEDVDVVTRNKRTVFGQFPICPLGCTSCSDANGCVTCNRHFYMLLVRDGMRQRGACTHSCPSGYYGVRRSHYSTCLRCNIDHCQSCFSRTYCTVCAAPYIAYRGGCIERCPDGLHYANYSKDCRETVDCMVGPWSEWAVCRRNGQTCGYKYGIRSRQRELLESPSPTGNICPELTENVCCRMAMRHCTDILNNKSDITIDRWKKHNLRRKKQRKRNRQIRKRRRERKRNPFYRQKERLNKKRRRRKQKNKKRKNNMIRNKTKADWKRICRRNVVLNDIDTHAFMYG